MAIVCRGLGRRQPPDSVSLVKKVPEPPATGRTAAVPERAAGAWWVHRLFRHSSRVDVPDRPDRPDKGPVVAGGRDMCPYGSVRDVCHESLNGTALFRERFGEGMHVGGHPHPVRQPDSMGRSPGRPDNYKGAEPAVIDVNRARYTKTPGRDRDVLVGTGWEAASVPCRDTGFEKRAIFPGFPGWSGLTGQILGDFFWQVQHKADLVPDLLGKRSGSPVTRLTGIIFAGRRFEEPRGYLAADGVAWWLLIRLVTSKCVPRRASGCLYNG